MHFGDVTVETGDDHVATVTIHRPPDNYFDIDLIRALADAYAAADARAIVLQSEGKHFCAGANFSGPRGEEPGSLYREAVRLFENETPVVAAVQGAAIGGGLGLACSADFRVATPNARFSANFARLGFHHGFGLSVTLPLIVGHQHALELLYTGRRIPGDSALAVGLCDRVVEADQLEREAHTLAAEIAASAPLAVASIRQTMRGHLADQFRTATAREAAEQDRLRHTADFAEGIRATAERRAPDFRGR